MEKKRTAKGDILLIAGIAAAGIIIAAAVLLFSPHGSEVVVRVDGTEKHRLPLTVDTRMVINGRGGSNTLVISSGEAWIEDADCPDGLCIKTGRISRRGQSIICLPHRVTVEIDEGSGGNNHSSSADIDVVAG